MDQECNQKLNFSVDGVAYQARQEPDLRWLRAYGRVFYAFDQLSSGNLCFGVEGPYGKLFIKYAGGRPVNYSGRPEDAIYTLSRAMKLYAKPHPALISPLAYGSTGEGYAAIFPWQNAAVLRPVPPDQTILNRVRALPVESSLKMLDMVFDLHGMLANQGLIAVDFWDGNVMIDFERNEALVCDIDLYRSKPAQNDKGRMPGSSRFLSPEEYELGAPLTESTTVYAMGALAFEFYGDNLDRSEQSWFGPKALYQVARRATQNRREQRYPSMRAFLDGWREAVGHSWLR